MSTSNPPANKKFVFKSDRRKANIFDKKVLNFYEKSELFDIVLIAGKNRAKIQAHIIVLSAFSEYFLEKFRSRCKVYNESKAVDATALKLIVDFMYLGWIELNQENVDSILRTAVFLKIKILIDGCCDFIEKHIHTNNCLKYFSLSNELCLCALKDTCFKYTNTYFGEISKRKELLQLNEIELKDLLANANPHGDSYLEEYIFLTIVAWIEHDNVNRKHLTFQLLSMVSYLLLKPKFILKNWSPVGKSTDSSELVYSWLRMLSEAQSNEKQKSDLKRKKEDVQMQVTSCLNCQKVVNQTSSHVFQFDGVPKETDDVMNSSNSEDIKTHASNFQQYNDEEVSDLKSKKEEDVQKPVTSSPTFQFESVPEDADAQRDVTVMNLPNSKDVLTQGSSFQQGHDQEVEDVQIPVISCSTSQEVVAEVSTPNSHSDAAPKEADAELEVSVMNSSNSKDVVVLQGSSFQCQEVINQKQKNKKCKNSTC